MALALQDKSFHLMGRLQSGNHAQIRERIEASGGKVSRQWTEADYIVADALPSNKYTLVRDFEHNGGQVVTTGWILALCSKDFPEEDMEDTKDLTIATNILDVYAGQHIANSSRSRKRDRSDEEDSDAGDLSQSTSTSFQTVLKRAEKWIRSNDSSPVVSLYQEKHTFPCVQSQSARIKARVQDLIVPLDKCYRGSVSDKVLVEDIIWDATLSLNDIQKNNNKFYVIQVTETKHGFYCFTRWGRVGTLGAQKLDFFTASDRAKDLFRKKYKEKTKRNFEDDTDTGHRKGVYMRIQKEYKVNSTMMRSSEDALQKAMTPVCSLDERVQKLVQIIMDEEVVKQQASSMGLDTEALPLGRLTRAQIGKGYLALSQLLGAIEAQENHDVLTELSSTFYTIIPHKTFGRDRATVLSTWEAVKSKLHFLHSLTELQMSAMLMREAQDNFEAKWGIQHLLDVKYSKLFCKITPLNKFSRERKVIDTYVAETHNDICSRPYQIKVEEVYVLEQSGRNCFAAHENASNRQLLWHCSRLGNFSGIIREGLRIAPPEAPTSGYRLGKGIYFADSLRKSSTYCWPTKYPSQQCLLLCEVALGNQQLLYEDDATAHQLRGNFDSTLAVGKRHNDHSGYLEISPGLVVPSGKEVDANLPRYTFFENNELVVYDPSRVRLKYLLLTTFERV